MPIAEDNLCEFADRLLTTSGQRSRYFGAAGGNLNSDVYHRSLIASGETERLLAGDPGHIDTPSPTRTGVGARLHRRHQSLHP